MTEKLLAKAALKVRAVQASASHTGCSRSDEPRTHRPVDDNCGQLHHDGRAHHLAMMALARQIPRLTADAGLEVGRRRASWALRPRPRRSVSSAAAISAPSSPAAHGRKITPHTRLTEKTKDIINPQSISP